MSISTDTCSAFFSRLQIPNKANFDVVIDCRQNLVPRMPCARCWVVHHQVELRHDHLFRSGEWLRSVQLPFAHPDSEANWPILVRVSSTIEPVLQATSALCLAIPVSVSALYGCISTIFDCPKREIIAGSRAHQRQILTNQNHRNSSLIFSFPSSIRNNL